MHEISERIEFMLDDNLKRTYIDAIFFNTRQSVDWDNQYWMTFHFIFLSIVPTRLHVHTKVHTYEEKKSMFLVCVSEHILKLRI